MKRIVCDLCTPYAFFIGTFAGGNFFFMRDCEKNDCTGLKKMCSCMLIMKHERADIGQSVIAKKMQIAKCNIVLLHGTLHGTLWTMYDSYVDHV